MNRLRVVRLLVLAGALAVVLGATAWWRGRPAPVGEARASLSLGDVFQPGTVDGFARAVAPRAFLFPVDHGPHPEYRTEWWYYTGNLDADGGGRAFGFQLTFFRVGLTPAPPTRASAWAARDLYFAHFALTDVRAGRFRAHESWSRGALGLSGATGAPFRVWVEDWTAEGIGLAAPPMRLRAAAGDVAIDLMLDTLKPPVLHGEQGLWRKGAEPGHATHYYSLTRMPARGTVRVGDAALPVRGLAWMDREWGASPLGAGGGGWDWFGLQLADGRDLMLYRLRRADGSVDPASFGSLVAPDGAVRALAAADAQVDVLAHWTSPRGGTRYPARWRVRVPAAALDLEVEPVVADQELDVVVRYWEGAVRVRGTAEGRGYVELTGYADASRQPSPRP
jgi:predicted secreted hydrolase